MANSGISFPDGKRYEQVIFQVGRVVLPGELNQIGRITNIRARRTDNASFDDFSSKEGDHEFSPCFTKDVRVFHSESISESIDPNDIRIGGNLGNRAQIKAYGYTFDLPEGGVTLTTEANPGLSNTYQQIYFTIKEEEVTGAADPSIVSQDLGETAVRSKLIVTWKVGAVNTDESLLYNNELEPWDGGERPVLVATIHRGYTNAPTSGNNIVTMWRQPTEMKSFIDRFFIGKVKLGPSVRSATADAAFSSWNSETGLTVSNLAVKLAFNLRNPIAGAQGYWTAKINGTFSLAQGMALVIIGPSTTADADSPSVGNTEYTCVPGTPGPGQLEVRMIDPRLIGWIQTTESPTMLDNIHVVALRTARDVNQVGTQYDVEIVFADGKTITREKKERPGNPILFDATVTWGHGNTWEDLIEPIGVDLPNATTDATPRYRSLLTARTNQLKIVTEMCVYPQSDSDSSIQEGRLLMQRRYVARSFRFAPGGDDPTYFSGEIVTMNAWWNQSTGKWTKDIDGIPATAAYHGIQEGASWASFPGSVQAWATHQSASNTPWDRDQWMSLEGIEDRWHIRVDGQGGIERSNRTGIGFGSLRDFYTTQYATNDQPLRSAGVTPVPGGRWVHYGSNRVAFYGVVRSFGGVIRLDNGAFNLTNPVLVDTGDVPGGNAYVELDIPDTAMLTGLTVTASLMWEHSEGSSVPGAIYNDYYQAYPSIDVNTPDKVRIYAVHGANPANSIPRAWALAKLQVSIVAFGGWKAAGPTFTVVP